jgi:hypothetical protein
MQKRRIDMVAGFKTLSTFGVLGKENRTPEANELEQELKDLEQQAFENFQALKDAKEQDVTFLTAEADRLTHEIKATRTRFETACKDVLYGGNNKCPYCGEYRIVTAEKRNGGRMVAHIVQDDCCKQRAARVIAKTNQVIENAQRRNAAEKIAFHRNNQERAASKGLTPEQRSEILNRPYKPDPNEIRELEELATIAERLEQRLTRGQIRDAQELQYA